MPDDQAPPKWSELFTFHDSDIGVEGRYDLDHEGALSDAVCRLCGAVVRVDYIVCHDVYHEEQGH